MITNETDLNALIVPESGDLSDPSFLSDIVEFLKVNKTKANLLQSRVVYEVKAKELYRSWPSKSYETFEQWGMEVLEKKRAMIYAIAKVYEVFILEHKVDIDRLVKIDFSKLSAASHHVNAENIKDILDLCERNNLYNLQKLLRSSKEPDPEKPVRFVFEVTGEQAEIIKEGILTAKELVKSEVPGKILEYVFADFLCSAGLESTQSHLELCVQALETAFNVNITVTPKENPIVLEGVFIDSRDS